MGRNSLVQGTLILINKQELIEQFIEFLSEYRSHIPYEVHKADAEDLFKDLEHPSF